MRPIRTELTERQIRAAELLTKGELSHKEIAEELGIARQTIQRWLREDDRFQELLHELSAECVNRAKVILRNYAPIAAKRIIAAAKGKGQQGWRAALELLKMVGLSGEAVGVVIQQSLPGLTAQDYELLAQHSPAGPNDRDIAGVL